MRQFAASLLFCSLKQHNWLQSCVKKSAQWARVVGAVAVLAPSPSPTLYLCYLSNPALCMKHHLSQ